VAGGLCPTSLAEALAQTVAWFGAHPQRQGGWLTPAR